MSSTQTTMTLEQVRQKHRTNLARLEAKRTGLLHITKMRQAVKAATLYRWVKDGALRVAEWNREEVKDRDGNEDAWMESLATKISPGQFIAYYHGKPGKGGKVVPTKGCPIVVYEGGHRTRWTEKVFDGLATYCGMTYHEICQLAPETARAIEEAVIELTLAVSENLAGLVEFARNEYEKVNTMGEGLKAGEVIRAGSDATRSTLETLLQDVLKRQLKSKKRDSHLEELRALVHGAAGLLEQMDKKKGSLTNVDPLTQEQEARAREMIREFGLVEDAIASLPELATAANQKRIQARKLELSVDGTLMWALQSAGGEAERAMVRADWVEYHKRFFGDKSVWKAMLASLKAATSVHRNYKESPFPARWRRVQAALRPTPAVMLVEDIDAVEPM